MKAKAACWKNLDDLKTEADSANLWQSLTFGRSCLIRALWETDAQKFFWFLPLAGGGSVFAPFGSPGRLSQAGGGWGCEEIEQAVERGDVYIMCHTLQLFCSVLLMCLAFFLLRTRIWWISTYLSFLGLNQTSVMLQCWDLWCSFAQPRRRWILLNDTRWICCTSFWGGIRSIKMGLNRCLSEADTLHLP